MTTQQKELIEKEAIKYVGHNLPLQEKALARHTFKEGAQFALSIANPWIKIEDGGRMPEDGQKVLVFCYNEQVTAQYTNGNFDNLWDCKEINAVNYWQPLPLPPTE